MTDAMSDTDANKLFNDISQAIKDTDSNKLSELTGSTAPDEDKADKPDPVVEQPDTVDEPDTPEDKDTPDDQPDDDKGDENDSPDEGQPNKSEDEGEDPPEKTEAELLKEQLQAAQKENHALRSQAGRVPYVQRRLKELDEKIAELTKGQGEKSGQNSAKVGEKMDALLKDLSETDATLAKTIKDAIVAATSGVDEEMATKELETLRLLRAQEAISHQEIEAARLMEQFPNAREVFNDPHWKQWKGKQSDGIRALAESASADDVAYAFKKYAEDMVSAYPNLAPKGDEGKTAETGTNEAREKAKKIEEDRKKRKETAANVASPNAPGKVSMPDDPDALFKKFSEQIRKERTG